MQGTQPNSLSTSTGYRASPLYVEAAGLTQQGAKRERDEDQFLIATVRPAVNVHQTTVPSLWNDTGEDSEATVIAVADGMGGHAGGAEASALAIDALVDSLRQSNAVLTRIPSGRAPQESLPGVRGELESAFAAAETRISQFAAGQQENVPPAHRMGTTLTVAAILSRQLYVAHIGDSRCYLLRAGTLFQLTRDQTVAEQLTSAGMELPDDSPLHHVLVGALGGFKDQPPRPEVGRWPVQRGDIVAVCSDGISGSVGTLEMTRILHSAGSSYQACVDMIAAARARGSSDDMTVVVARIS